MSAPCPASMISGGGKPAVVFALVVLVVWAIAAQAAKNPATPAQPQRDRALIVANHDNPPLPTHTGSAGFS